MTTQKHKLNDYYYKLKDETLGSETQWMSWQEVCELRRQPGTYTITEKMLVEEWHKQNPPKKPIFKFVEEDNSQAVGSGNFVSRCSLGCHFNSSGECLLTECME